MLAALYVITVAGSFFYHYIWLNDLVVERQEQHRLQHHSFSALELDLATFVSTLHHSSDRATLTFPILSAMTVLVVQPLSAF